MENDNDTATLSTASSVLEDEIASNVSYTVPENSGGLAIGLWRYGWPPLCMMGLVGNTLVLLVLRRDGLVRTSANVYLSALAVGDSLVLMVTSISLYPGLIWHWWLEDTSKLACHTVRQIRVTLADVSTLFIVAFTVERCVVVRFPLLKLRLCTPRNAGLCCGSLLVLVFVKNVDLFFTLGLTSNGSGAVVCKFQSRYTEFIYIYYLFNVVVRTIIPVGVVVICNWAIIRTLRRNPMPVDTVTRTTLMCVGVSIAYIVCVIPVDMFTGYYLIWPPTPKTINDVLRSLVFLRYANHAINIFLYSLTGAHFRRELVALCRSCIQCATSAAVGFLTPHRRFEDEMEMR